MTVRTVLWDADGVLQRIPNGWHESMRPAVEGRVDDVEAFLQEAWREERPALAGQARWTEVLPGLLERWGIADSYDEVLAVWLSIEEVPGTHDVVRALRDKGIRCCLATNQDVHRGRHMHGRFAYADLFDEAFYSYELGVAKPDPGYFRAILGRLGAPAHEVLFLDDNQGNVDAARSVGLHAEQWQHEHGLDALLTLLDEHGLPVRR